MLKTCLSSFVLLFLFACMKDSGIPQDAPRPPTGTLCIYTTNKAHASWVYDIRLIKGMKLRYIDKEVKVCDSFSFQDGITVDVGVDYLVTIRDPNLDVLGFNPYSVSCRVYLDTVGCRMFDIE